MTPSRTLRQRITPSRASLLLAVSILTAPALFVGACATAQPASVSSRGSLPARQTQYIDAAALDLVRLLPPAPANDSAETRAELEEMLDIQKTRTASQAARARADAQVNLVRFADALGDPPPGFDLTKLPLTQLLFRKISTDELVVVGTGKDAFARPRPFVLEPRLQPIVARPPSASYPSGHTVWGYTVGLVLADMIPERRPQLMARAAEYAQNRVVAGVHYPSDVEGGKMAATAFATALFASPAFQTDLAAAKAELRHALNLR
jgi:acid phosphatase (class A)